MWWCGGGGFFTDYNTTPTKVVLSCFGLLVGLWQLTLVESRDNIIKGEQRQQIQMG